jgi:hypothetical protein
VEKHYCIGKQFIYHNLIIRLLMKLIKRSVCHCPSG